MERSLKDTVKVTHLEDPANVTDDNASTGVDTSLGGSLMFLVSVGTFAFSGSNKIDILVQDSDVDTDASYANCVDADIHDAEDGANGIAKTLDTTDDDNSTYAVHYRGNKRYARIKLDETGTVDCPFSICAVQSHLRANPPA